MAWQWLSCAEKIQIEKEATVKDMMKEFLAILCTALLIVPMVPFGRAQGGVQSCAGGDRELRKDKHMLVGL